MSKKIAVIPARGGSKRIPKKNIKDFFGKPIISYSIIAAVESELFDEVMVSTDDNAIIEIAKQYGADVPFVRSAVNSNDYATTSEVLLEVLKEYGKIGKEFKYMCCIYPTAPFITSQKLKNSFNELVRDDIEAVIPVVKFSYPVQRALSITDKGALRFLYPENLNKRSQDLEPIYHDAGQFYWCEVEAFLKYKSLILPKAIPFIIPETEVQDIDNESDWEIAELKYKMLNNF